MKLCWRYLQGGLRNVRAVDCCIVGVGQGYATEDKWLQSVKFYQLARSSALRDVHTSVEIAETYKWVIDWMVMSP